MKRFFAILVVLVMALAMAAPSFAEEKVMVGVAMPTQSLQRWNQDGEYLKATLEAMGYEVMLTFSDNDATRQATDIENMLTAGCKVLVVASIDGGTLGTVLATAKEMGVPVIAYDRMIVDTDAVEYYVTFDNYNVGVIQGSFLVEALDLENAEGPFNIEIVAGSPDDTNAGFFYNGAMDQVRPFIEAGKVIVPSGQIEFEVVGTPTWASAVAQARFENILSANYAQGEVLDAVLCSNDSTAFGVITALQGAGFDEDNWPVITGQDCDMPNMQYIVSGLQAMSVFKDTRTLAKEAAGMVDAFLKGEEIPFTDDETYNNNVQNMKTFICTPVFGSADNYVELLIDSGYYVIVDGEFTKP